MNLLAHRPPHSRSDDEDEQDPSHLPVDPDDGSVPGGVTGEPDPEGVVDPTV